MTIIELCVYNHIKIQELRRIKLFINSETFKVVYDKLPEEKKKEAEKYIKEGKELDLKKLIRIADEIPLDCLNMNKLRIFGKYFRITNYSRMNRYDLLTEIERFLTHDKIRYDKLYKKLFCR